jgi:hypothetical protein
MIDFDTLKKAFEQLYDNSNCLGLPLENDGKPYGENTVLFLRDDNCFAEGEDCPELAEILRELGW